MKPTQIDAKTKQTSSAVMITDGLELINDDRLMEADEERRLAELYRAAKDENELLEFKNYELLFKIQELEQNQRNILSKLVINEKRIADIGPEEPVIILAEQLAVQDKLGKVGSRQPIKLMINERTEEHHEDRYLAKNRNRLGPPTTDLAVCVLGREGEKSPTERRQELHNNRALVGGLIDAAGSTAKAGSPGKGDTGAATMDGNETGGRHDNAVTGSGSANGNGNGNGQVEVNQGEDIAKRRRTTKVGQHPSDSNSTAPVGGACSRVEADGQSEFSRLTEAAFGRSQGARSDPASESELDLLFATAAEQQVAGDGDGRSQCASELTWSTLSGAKKLVGELEMVQPLTGGGGGGKQAVASYCCRAKSEARHHLEHEKLLAIASERPDNKLEASAIGSLGSAAVGAPQQQVAACGDYSIARKTNKGEIFGLHDTDSSGRSQWKCASLNGNGKKLAQGTDELRIPPFAGHHNMAEPGETSLGAEASVARPFEVSNDDDEQRRQLIEYNGGQRAFIVGAGRDDKLGGRQQQVLAVGGLSAAHLQPTSGRQQTKVMIMLDEIATSGEPKLGQLGAGSHHQHWERPDGLLAAEAVSSTRAAPAKVSLLTRANSSFAPNEPPAEDLDGDDLSAREELNDNSKTKQDSVKQRQSVNDEHLQPEESSMPTAAATASGRLGEEARKIGQSQPELANLTDRCAANKQARFSGGARIAVPVARHRLVSGAPRNKQQSATGAINRSSSAATNNGLRARSKSSLDQSALVGRRAQGASCVANQQVRAAPANKVALTTNHAAATKQTNSNHANHSTTTTSAMESTQVDKRLEDKFGGTLADARLGAQNARCGSLTNARVQNRSRSSSAIGFVTQIPTLIGQLHAQPAQQIASKRRKPASEATGAAGAPTLDGSSERDSSLSLAPLPELFSNRQTTERRAMANGQIGQQVPMNGSKSMSNLVAPFKRANEFVQLSGGGGSGGAGCVERTNSIPALPLAEGDHDDEANDGRQKLATDHHGKPAEDFSRNGKQVGQLENLTDYHHDDDDGGGIGMDCERDKANHRSGSLLPKAVVRTGCVSSAGSLPANDCSKSLVNLTQSVELDEPIGQLSGKSLADVSRRDESQQAAAGQQQQQQQQQQCAQCKLFQSKLNLLIRDRKQLNEQVNELEEMENDSRLMSQKLAKQLVALEEQFESCKLELQKTCDNEAMLQFQNKRLNFELRQRLESIQRLQGQVGKLQQQQQLASLRQQVACSPSSGSVANNGRSNADLEVEQCNNGPNSTRNAHEIQATSQTDSQEMLVVTAQSPIEADNKTDGAKEKPSSPSASSNGTLSNPSDDHSPALSMSTTSQHSDDDSAIDVFEKRTEAHQFNAEGTCLPGMAVSESDLACKSVGIDRQELADCGERNGRHGAGTNCEKAPLNRLPSQAEDSAYSKSSGSSSVSSSDVHSDDGGRSDGEQADLEPPPSVSKSDCDATGEQPIGASSGGRQSQINSSSSSGDESDHHEIIGCSGASSSSTTIGSLANSDGSQVGTGLAGRQQVLRKKISTARILRGIQVQQQSPIVSGGSQPTANKSTLINQSVEDGLDGGQTEPGFLGQARLAQVIDGCLTGTRNQDGQVDKSCGARKEEQQQQVGSTCQSKQQRSVTSPIDLALKGVDDLERGGSDEVLRSLVGPTNTLTGANDEDSDGRQVQELPAAIPKVLSSSSSERALINQCKQEIASLKMRLLQAHTLNDNLVAELKSNKNHQPVGHYSNLSRQQSPSGGCSIKLIDQQPKQRQQVRQIADELVDAHLRQRSVIYVNGVQASVTNHHHHHHGQIGSSSSPSQIVLGSQSGGSRIEIANSTCTQQSQIGAHHKTACINLDELVDLLRFLLDKVHFHHQRTFELVNECQKLAMNALLASYGHQMNLVHYNNVVLAGNQAAQVRQQHQQRQALPGELAGVITQQQQQQQSSQSLYPVRPPPRRRNALSRMLVSGSQQTTRICSDEHDDEQQQQHQRQQLEPPSGRNPDCELQPPTGGRGPVSALQVAKQTLFSIVPIYYNSTNAATGGNSSKNKKEKLSDCPKQTSTGGPIGEATAVANESGQRITQPTNGNSAGSNDRRREDSRSKGGWILLNRSSSASAATKTASSKHQQPEAADYLKPASPVCHVNEQRQQNVSILKINRSDSKATDLLINDYQHQSNQTDSAQQQQPNIRTYALQGSLQEQQQQQQHLVKVKNSLSEDIERYRVRFNGQLLDLLTRQNWCESIITDKLRNYQTTIDHNQRSFNASRETNRPNLVMETQSIINTSPSTNKSANVPINKISLNPNGSVHQSQSLMPSGPSTPMLLHQQQHQRHSWTSQGHSASSFC